MTGGLKASQLRVRSILQQDSKSLQVSVVLLCNRGSNLKKGVGGEVVKRRNFPTENQWNNTQKKACELKSPKFHASPHRKTLWWQIICLPLLLSMWHSSLLYAFPLLLSYYGHGNSVAVGTTRDLIHRLSLS